MGHMKYEHTKPYEDWFWAKNRIELVFDHVQNVDFAANRIFLSASSSIDYDHLIIAAGSQPNKMGWPGQELGGVSGLYSLQDLGKIENATQNIERATVVGGGLIGIELAEMLVSRKINVNFLVRESHFWANVLPENEGRIIEKEIRNHGVNLVMETELDSIIGDENGKAKAIKTKNGEIIESQFVGLTVGVSPNISFLQSTDLQINKGVLVNEYLQTNFENVWAIGDCAEHQYPQPGRKAIEQIWYTGKIMGETLAKTICGNLSKYEPGIFYNSAKFFDIEYSVYGSIQANLPENMGTYYWENNSGNKCLRINYLADSEDIMGIHAFGIRLRASSCLAWLKNKTNFKKVIQELKKANFEPEFSNNYLTQISMNG